MTQGRTYLTVTEPKGMPVIFQGLNDQSSAFFALMATQSPSNVAMRIGGGCKDMQDEMRAQMFPMWTEGTDGRFKGVVFSGGTRDGKGKLMVTDLPGHIRSTNPECIALGTAPRTDLVRLVDESVVNLDGYGTLINPNMSGVMLVQDGPDDKLEWDGDLGHAFKLLEQLEQIAYPVVYPIINGGGVTLTEAKAALKHGWLTIIHKGSLRVADDLVRDLDTPGAEIHDFVKDPGKIEIVQYGDGQGLKRILESHHILD